MQNSDYNRFEQLYSILDDKQKLKNILNHFNQEEKILLLSYFAYAKKDKNAFILMLKLIKNSQIDKNTRYFYLYQSSVMEFMNKELSSTKVFLLFKDIYTQIYHQFLSEIKSKIKIKKIKKENRNKKNVVVFTPQLLELNHAPTRRVLDRCKGLINLGYKVLLINTAEVLSLVNKRSFYSIAAANYASFENEFIEYENIKIPLYQSPKNTPNIDEIIKIINIVKEFKPYFIFSYGNFTITSDIVNNLIPVCNVPLGHHLPISEANFLISGKIIYKSDKKIIKKYKIDKKRIILDPFKFKLKKQEKFLTKKDLKIPKNKFILVIVGARLDSEIDNKFIKLLLKTVKFNTFIVFAGIFERYDELINKNRLLKQNSLFLGFQKDMFAVLDNCDLYINPIRSGGGASSAEAMSKGIPVVTFRYGDVYGVVGDKFSVKNNKSFVKIIKKYATNKKFYKKMSKLALKKAKIITNPSSTLPKIIKKIVKSEYFF